MSKKNITQGEISDAEATSIIAEGNEKFAYLEDKDPTAKQEFYAEVISALTGVKVSPKQYQAMISTHRYIQASDLNRARADYRPRTAESVIKASETLLENASSLVVDDEGALISKSATHIPEEIFAPGVLARLAAEAEAAAEGSEEEADEIQAEEVEADEVEADEVEADEVEADEVEEPKAVTAEDLSKLTKAELIEDIIQQELEVNGEMTDDELESFAELREHELKRLNKAALIALAERALV
jgi:hypothetical protein